VTLFFVARWDYFMDAQSIEFNKIKLFKTSQAFIAPVRIKWTDY
jgi:hypothetical protein